MGKEEKEEKLLEKRAKKLEKSRTAMIYMLKDLNRTKKELTAAKEYTDNIIKSIVDTLIVVNPDTTIRTVNQATLKLLGYKEDELVGQPVGIIFEKEEQQQLLLLQLQLQLQLLLLFKGTRLEKLLKEGSVRDYDTTYLTKNKVGEIQTTKSVLSLLKSSLLNGPSIKAISKVGKKSGQKVPIKIRDPDIIDTILSLSKDPNPVVRRSAVFILGRIKYKDA